ncbi:family 43 glycosylhydrolase [Amphibacillus sp. Q70]|uniref:glycoside hydrolase family 43 protein n=1 Tax=Amphibacillus sp. Q70 TaxID=3453416 RepID=UPI003F8593AE
MKTYKNPIIPGFYPDPSICYGNGYFYLVTSSFEYYPGIPLFKSDDLINWDKIGYCLDKKNQLYLDNAKTSSGLFAPTIRFFNGWFYVITTNITTNQNLLVKSKNPEMGWSDPVIIDGWSGIDPSLFFDDDGKVYIQGNSYKSDEPLGIFQAEIDLDNGKLVSERRLICKGTGGKAPEAPHIYKKDGFYYLVMAEGGTEYGHMSTIFRSHEIFGPYIGNPENPIITNRSTPSKIQCVGHADLIQDKRDNWWAVCLGVRINGSHSYYHHLGRETFLIPLEWREGEWPKVSNNGVVDFEMSGPLINDQKAKHGEKIYEFNQINKIPKDFAFLRNPEFKNYLIGEDQLLLRGTPDTLDSIGNVTFLGHRQSEFHMQFKVQFSDISSNVNFGVSTFMSNHFHYDCIVRGNQISLRKKIGSVETLTESLSFDTLENISLIIESDEKFYKFLVEIDNEQYEIGQGECAFLSTEISGTFTGTMLGVFCYSNTYETVGVKRISYKEL